ncbi:TRPT1 [Symbiodinium sp. CCMP2592]|nr:TRPT1 [Symbiodinium sp. CCMP2592]
MLQKRASRRPGTNRNPNTEDLLQHALEQEEKLKDIVGRLFHRLEVAGVHVDIDTADADAEVPILGSRKIRNKEDLFETCRAPQALTQTAHVVPSQRRDSQSKLSCSSGFPIFDLSQGDYVCCPTAALYCAGCFQLDGSSCAQCSPGFVEVAGEGRCQACVDTPGWTNLDGENCIQAVCSDTAYYGLSSKQACCGCGGGQRAATPFTYYVAPTVLFATSITGFPVPRTARNYTINEDCKLLEHGLAINGATGSLQIAPGADKVGRNLLEAFSISCTIVAHQTSSLSASATLTVVAQKSISYGQYPLLFRADVTNRYDPVVMGDWSFDQLNCDPSDITAELRLGQRGRVRWPNPDKAASAGGVLADGFDMRGAICRVRGTSTPVGFAQMDEGTGQFPPPVETVISYFVTILPSVWENLRYERARTIVGRLQVTVGQVAATVNVEVPDQAIRLVPPTAFTGKCSSENGGIVTLDTVTGQGTYQGFPFFDMDLTTGSVRLAPSQELASLMPTDAGARAALTVSCTIYGLYQFPPFGDGPVLQEVIYLGATDDTCFVPKTGNYYFLEQRSLTVSGPTQCRTECRKDSTCTYYSLLSSTSCYLYKGLCPDAGTPGCSQASGSVFARVLGCAERTTCIQLSLSKHFLSGRYCYYGENNYRGGLVFLKEGITSFESFWLHRKSRDFDVWVLQKPAQGDFYNASAAYMTFSGEEMATINSGIDLIADVFNQGTATFPITYSAGELVLGDFYVKQKPTGAPQERQFVSATDESQCLSTASHWAQASAVFA